MLPWALPGPSCPTDAFSTLAGAKAKVCGAPTTAGDVAAGDDAPLPSPSPESLALDEDPEPLLLLEAGVLGKAELAGTDNGTIPFYYGGGCGEPRPDAGGCRLFEGGLSSIRNQSNKYNRKCQNGFPI